MISIWKTFDRMHLREIIRKVFFYLNNKKILINGCKYYIPEVLMTFLNVRRNNLIEPDLINYVKEIDFENKNVVDIGANFGLFSLYASNQVGKEGKVIAFEPNPFVTPLLIEFLQKNTTLNNWIVNSSAIANENSIVKFSISLEDNALMERSGLMINDRNEKPVYVLASKLDKILENYKIDIIKIDVEGSEMEVLKGAENTIDHFRPIVIVEIHGLYFDNPKHHASNVFDFFNNKNYKAYNIHKKEFESLESFKKDSGFHSIDRVALVNLSEKCYGNISFIPE